MRPRHLCRGNAQDCRTSPGSWPASMRPRHLCRGNAVPTCTGAPRDASFNEATASLPWKRPHQLLHSPAPKCFNEATASLPWKHDARSARTAPRGIASMRPRHLCRGNVSVPARLRHGHRGFNEATASLPWKRSAPTTMPPSPTSFNEATASLPWKPRTHGIRSFGQHASMRPRHLCRGNHNFHIT